MAEFAFLSDLGFPKPPPVSMPRLAPRPSADRWVPWPWPRVAMISPTLINETSAARSSLSPILKDIVPLRRRHLNAPLTMSFLTAATKIYERLCTWWDGIHRSLRSLDVLDEAPPHVFMVAYVPACRSPYNTKFVFLVADESQQLVAYTTSLSRKSSVHSRRRPIYPRPIRLP